MKPIKERQVKILQTLCTAKVEGEMRLYVWHPTKILLNWLLELSGFNVTIHPDVEDIITLFDAGHIADSQSQITVYLKNEDIDDIREHPKLKDLYNEWFYSKQKKGGEQIDES